MRTTLYKPGQIYLVSFHIVYKLGVTTAMHFRMTEYRMIWRNYFDKRYGVQAPEIVHMYSVQNMRETEKAIQARWKRYRWTEIPGTEYFDLPPDEVDWFRLGWEA